jgi:hypothetical protein
VGNKSQQFFLFLIQRIAKLFARPKRLGTTGFLRGPCYVQVARKKKRGQKIENNQPG